MKARVIVVAASVLFAPMAEVLAQDSHKEHWNVQIGPAYVYFHEFAVFNVAGVPALGANARLQNNTTLAAEFSYRFTRNWSAGLTIGIPARTRVTGAGTTETFGEMGAGRYGPMVLTARYTINDIWRWHPYVGAGVTYFVILKEYNAFITNLHINNAFGSAVQVGTQYDINSWLSLFFDIKKLYVRTSSHGNLPTLGGAPVSADVRLNPSVFQAGISYRF